jgi:transglutaminase-like putative cysteine protease
MKLKASAFFAYQIGFSTPFITILKPRTDFSQKVLSSELNISPNLPIQVYIDLFGNECQRMLMPAGVVKIAAQTLVETPGIIERNFEAEYTSIENLPSEAIQFLLPSRYCHSDTNEIIQLANNLIFGIEKVHLQVEKIRKWIFENISYQYGYSYYTTSSNDLLKTRVGVCRDFAHLAIALCRSLNIPARIVVGYLKDLPFSDLHAWFEVYIGNKWYTYDAIQEETLPGRIILAVGRDANDVAFITQFGNPEMLEMKVVVEHILD